MNLDTNKKDILEYLKKFKKEIPKRTSFFTRNQSVDTSNLDGIKDKSKAFFERGVLISPKSINNNSINQYTDVINLVKQFPKEYRPDSVMENEILGQTKNVKMQRRVLIPNIIEENSQMSENYDKMVAYYLLMGGDKPVERFSRTEMQMKQYGITPNMGVSIMKYGDKITTKLEELTALKTKSPKEWECFKAQVLHSFNTAEKIGNRNVNIEEHLNWEERLIKLGILERRIDRDQNKIFKKSLRSSVKTFGNSIDKSNEGKDKDKDKDENKVVLGSTLDKIATEKYLNTGMVPMGYKKDKNGNLVNIMSKLDDIKIEGNLSFPKDKLSSSKKKEPKNQGISR